MKLSNTAVQYLRKLDDSNLERVERLLSGRVIAAANTFGIVSFVAVLIAIAGKFTVGIKSPIGYVTAGGGPHAAWCAQ